MSSHKVKNFGVASNPEFLPEGNAVDAVAPAGPGRGRLLTIRRTSRSCAGSTPNSVNHVRIHYIETTPETAEAIKYVANTLLLTYISFWNGVGATIGETFGNCLWRTSSLG